jgi:uncharacterized membrane protein YgcG
MTSKSPTMDQPTKRRRRWPLALLLLLLCGATYGGYRLFRTDPAVKRVRELRKELAAGANLPPEQRREKSRQLREALEKLPPDKREAMRREMAEDGRKRFEAQLKTYAKLSPTEKTRYLDEQIDRFEQFRSQRQQQQGQGGSSSAGGGSGTGGGGAFGFGPRGGGPNGNAQGGPGNSQRSPEERERRRKQMLDDTTPEFRALRDQFFKDMQARRQQRGMPGR